MLLECRCTLSEGPPILLPSSLSLIRNVRDLSKNGGGRVEDWDFLVKGLVSLKGDIIPMSGLVNVRGYCPNLVNAWRCSRTVPATSGGCFVVPLPACQFHCNRTRPGASGCIILWGMIRASILGTLCSCRMLHIHWHQHGGIVLTIPSLWQRLRRALVPYIMVVVLDLVGTPLSYFGLPNDRQTLKKAGTIRTYSHWP